MTSFPYLWSIQCPHCTLYVCFSVKVWNTQKWILLVLLQSRFIILNCLPAFTILVWPGLKTNNQLGRLIGWSTQPINSLISNWLFFPKTLAHDLALRVSLSLLSTIMLHCNNQFLSGNHNWLAFKWMREYTTI